MKPHPVHDTPAYYRDLGAGSSSSHRIHVLEGSVNLQSLLPICDVAVLVGGPSTAALEAMIAGAPVAFIRYALFDVRGFRTSLDDEGVVWIDELDRLDSTILDLLNNASIRAEALERGRRFVRWFASSMGPDAVRDTSAILTEKAPMESEANWEDFAWRRAMARAIGEATGSVDLISHVDRMAIVLAEAPKLPADSKARELALDLAAQLDDGGPAGCRPCSIS